MPPDDLLRDALEWLRYAEADIALASIPLPANVLYEQLCFHAQQAAEKAIKAVLVAQGLDFPKTHNIEFLLTLLPSHVTRNNFPAQANRLTSYATIFRYPGEEEPVSLEDYQTLLSISRDVVTWAKKTIAGT